MNPVAALVLLPACARAWILIAQVMSTPPTSAANRHASTSPRQTASESRSFELSLRNAGSYRCQYSGVQDLSSYGGNIINMSVREQLRAESDAGGVGFCYESDPWLFSNAESTHGPLVVVWDSNIVIYFHDYGRRLVNGDEIDGVDDGLAEELDALSMLVNWWFVRDIRFVVPPALDADEKRSAREDRRCRRMESIRAVSQALTFQLDEWGNPDSTDDQLFAEVEALNVQVTSPLESLLMPFPDKQSDDALDHPDCPYAYPDVIAGDLGKLPLLLSVLGDE